MVVLLITLLCSSVFWIQPLYNYTIKKNRELIETRNKPSKIGKHSISRTQQENNINHYSSNKHHYYDRYMGL